MNGNFVQPEEISYFVDSLRPFELKQVGCPLWLDIHERIVNLSQQAVLEALEHREEEVKEFLISRDKLKVLVHEAWCINIWKTRVLPLLLEINPNPDATFMIYTVLYHEGSAIALLDTALYHGSACEMLKDSAIDLVDYCAQGVANLIGLTHMGYHENCTDVDVDGSVLTELERQKRDIIFKIGLRCITLLSYMAENAKLLPLSATRRMVTKHDIPWMMADLLTCRPWERKMAKTGLQRYIQDKWVTIKPEDRARVEPTEAQAWFCLLQLLMNPELMESYDWTEERRRRLGSLNGMLHETLLDQLPPLIQFKQYLCHVQAAGSPSSTNRKSDLLLEEIPEIYDKIIDAADRSGGFYAIAEMQEKIFLTKDQGKILQMAQRMAKVYNTDLLAEVENKEKEKQQREKCDEEKEETEKNKDEKVPKQNPPTANAKKGDATPGAVPKNPKKCSKCGKMTQKKCQACLEAYYCSRECQQSHWPEHKKVCGTCDWESPD